MEAAGGADGDGEVDRAHSGLRDDRAHRRSCDSHVEPVDEECVEADIGNASDSRDDQRGLRVLEPAQQSGGRDDHEHEWQAPP